FCVTLYEIASPVKCSVTAMYKKVDKGFYQRSLYKRLIIVILLLKCLLVFLLLTMLFHLNAALVMASSLYKTRMQRANHFLNVKNLYINPLSVRRKSVKGYLNYFSHVPGHLILVGVCLMTRHL